MGKTGKWIKNLLTGKKDKEKEKEKELNASNQPSSVATENPSTPVVIRPTTPKEKRRWSFRRSSATAAGPKDSTPKDGGAPPAAAVTVNVESEGDKKKHEMVVAAATAAAADAAVAAAQAAASVIHLSNYTNGSGSAIEEAAAIKIQSVFRSYLARKALRALRGLVKLQALVRGHLVRKQATTTLRCMQALVSVQARVRAQRIRAATEEEKTFNHRQSTHRRNSQEYKSRLPYREIDKVMEENIKIVEMDHGEFKASSKSRNSYSSNQHYGNEEQSFSTHYTSQHTYTKDYQQISPAPSAITDVSPRTCSGHFEDYSFATAQSSPQCFSAMSRPDPSRTLFSFPRPDYAESMSSDYPLYPNYMANTESSKAKVRSQSAPKQRPEFERQPSRGRRPSVEGRNIPRAARMQRSSSHVGSTAQNYQYPWCMKLDKSTVSLKDSECGSTCSVLTNTNYGRSLVSFDIHGNRY